MEMQMLYPEIHAMLTANNANGIWKKSSLTRSFLGQTPLIQINVGKLFKKHSNKIAASKPFWIG